MTWSIQVERAAGNTLLRAEPNLYRAAKRIMDRLKSSSNPRRMGIPLCDEFEGYYKIRVRKNWRLIYGVSEAHRTITVVIFGHRSNVYKRLGRTKRK